MPSDGFDFLDSQFSEKGDISCAVAISCGISYPILRQIAGIDDPSVHRLGHCVKCSHADPWGKVDTGLRCGRDTGSFQLLPDGIYWTFNVYDYTADA